MQEQMSKGVELLTFPTKKLRYYALRMENWLASVYGIAH